MLQRTPTATDDAATRSIAEIRIGERHRKDLGDLQSLAQDIAELGLIHAIPIASRGHHSTTTDRGAAR